MKRVLFGATCLMSLALSAPALAEDGVVVRQDLDARGVQNIFEENKEYFTSVDYQLDRLLSIPEDKRQYFYPMLFEHRIISHKIISHPEILKYKGKKPTVIAPRLAAFAEKYLDALPAAFYPYLSPEKWLTLREKRERLKTMALPNIDDLPLLPKENVAPDPDYQAPSIEEVYKIPEKLPDNFWHSDLMPADVARTIDTLNALPEFVNGLDSDLAATLRDFLGENLPLVLAWPIREWTNHFGQTPYADKLEPFLKTKGWENTQAFIDTADTLIKAYRASNMRLTDAMVLSKFRKEYPIRANETFMPVQMMAEQYNAKAADAVFVKKYAPALKAAFKNQNLIRMGLPINQIY